MNMNMKPDMYDKLSCDLIRKAIAQEICKETPFMADRVLRNHVANAYYLYNDDDSHIWTVHVGDTYIRVFRASKSASEIRFDLHDPDSLEKARSFISRDSGGTTCE